VELKSSTLSSIQIRACGGEAAMPHHQTWQPKLRQSRDLCRGLDCDHHATTAGWTLGRGCCVCNLTSLISPPSTPHPHQHTAPSPLCTVKLDFKKDLCGSLETSQNKQNGAKTVEIKYGGTSRPC